MFHNNVKLYVKRSHHSLYFQPPFQPVCTVKGKNKPFTCVEKMYKAVDFDFAFDFDYSIGFSASL